MSISLPIVDYTDKDAASLREAMLDLAQYRFPEWTDRSPADLGVLLVDLFSAMADTVLYYQDRAAAESFLSTAQQRRSVLQLLRLIGYELAGPVPASADLSLVFNAPTGGASSLTTVPHGTSFSTQDPTNPQTFEYTGPNLSIDVSSSQVTPRADGKLVYSGLSVIQQKALPTEILGSSTGEPNQSFALSQSPALTDTLVVEVNEGAGFVAWTYCDNLLYVVAPDGSVTLSGPDSQNYYVQVDENGVSRVVFGDGQYGKRPAVGTNNIRATYAIGGGSAGNVAPNSITVTPPGINLLDSVSNPVGAAGGADAETADHGVQFGPLAFRSGARAVTLSDFVSLTHQAGGVAKVGAHTTGWNRVDLYVVPEGTSVTVAPVNLKTQLVSYFEDKRMVGTSVTIRDPAQVPVDISVQITVQHNYSASSVLQQATDAVNEVVAFDNVDLGTPVYLSKVYEATDAVPGVLATNVAVFRRHDTPALPVDVAGRLAGVDQLVPDAVWLALSGQIAPDGRIDIADTEIAVPGTISVTLSTDVPS
jgi:hypothetical protein